MRFSDTAAVLISRSCSWQAWRSICSSRPAAKLRAGDPHGHGKHHAARGVELSDAKIAAAGIELEKAGPGELHDSLFLNGILQPNQETLVQVTPRFPGVAREIHKRIGDRVEKGELLAKIESNQSLTVYELSAPLAGTIIDRQVALGEHVGEQKPAFTIADLSTVWVDFSVYRRDLKRVNVGDTVMIDAEDGGPPIETKISYVSPVGSSDTQSALARAVVSNQDLRLRPGLFVTGGCCWRRSPSASPSNRARFRRSKTGRSCSCASARNSRCATSRSASAIPSTSRSLSACSKAMSTPPRTVSSSRRNSRRDRLAMSTESGMAIVTALIRPDMEGRVVRALHDLPEFPGFFVTEVRGQGRGRGAGGAYTATEFDLTYHHFLQLQLVCRPAWPAKSATRSLQPPGPGTKATASFSPRKRIHSCASARSGGPQHEVSG